MIDALKFVWAYMLEQGHILENLEWDYYLGFVRIHGYDWELNKQADNDLQAKVKEIGIDWDKTKEPKSNQESMFTDTFSPNARIETLTGTLYLKDGSSYAIGVRECETRFSEYAIMLSKLAEDSNRVKNILGE
jgi:hypothetical protein